MYQSSMIKHIVKYDASKANDENKKSLLNMIMKMFDKKNNDINQKKPSYQYIVFRQTFQASNIVRVIHLAV